LLATVRTERVENIRATSVRLAKANQRQEYEAQR
jgi:hypothetical protein